MQQRISWFIMAHMILRLRFEENSLREIAKRIGLGKAVVDCKMNVMLKFFRKNINKFF